MDQIIALFIHQSLPQDGFFLSFFKAITFLGSTFFISIIVIFSGIFFLFRGRFHKAHIMLLAGIFSGIASTLAKYLIKRPRPDIWALTSVPDSYSFPSGHALITLVVFGMISYFLAEHYPKPKRIIYSSCLVLLFLVGLSRVYLGIHWPSDVLGGWIIGTLLLLALVWWYKKGGILKAARWFIGFFAIGLGLIGLILPIIPGIPLLIAGFLLIFSERSLADMFKKKKNL